MIDQKPKKNDKDFISLWEYRACRSGNWTAHNIKDKREVCTSIIAYCYTQYIQCTVGFKQWNITEHLSETLLIIIWIRFFVSNGASVFVEEICLHFLQKRWSLMIIYTFLCRNILILWPVISQGYTCYCQWNVVALVYYTSIYIGQTISHDHMTLCFSWTTVKSWFMKKNLFFSKMSRSYYHWNNFYCIHNAVQEFFSNWGARFHLCISVINIFPWSHDYVFNIQSGPFKLGQTFDLHTLSKYWSQCF